MYKLNKHIVQLATFCLLCLATFFVNNDVINADIMESRNIVVCHPTIRGKGWMIVSAAVIALVIGLWWYTYIYHHEAMISVAGKESGSWLNHNVRPWYYHWTFILESGVWSLLLLSAKLQKHL